MKYAVFQMADGGKKRIPSENEADVMLWALTREGEIAAFEGVF